MESEKVKEIKELLKRKAKEYESQTYLDILTLINELESENERLRKCREADYKTMTALRQANTELNECMDEMQDRIALLEKDNKLLRNAKVVYETVDYCYEDLKKAEKRIAELEKEIKETPSYARGYADGIKNTYEVVVPDKLKRFAEMLIDKKIKLGERFNIYDIDETLKEFIK